MNKLLLLLGLVVVCVCAGNIREALRDIDVEELLARYPGLKLPSRAPPSDGLEIFAPNGVQCRFALLSQVSLNTTTIADDGTVNTELEEYVETTYYYGFMKLVEREQTKPTSSFVTTLIRLDLNETINGINYATQFVHDGSSCQKSMVPIKDVEAEGMKERAFFTEKYAFQGMNSTTFYGADCFVFYNESSTTDFFLFVDENEDIIGHYYASKTPSKIVSKTFVFDIESDRTSLSDFALDPDENPGCDAAAYTAPVEFECVGAIYEPGPLPCPFGALRMGGSEKVVGDEIVAETFASVLVYDGLLSLHERQSNNTAIGNFTIIRRGDLMDDNGIPVFSAHNAPDTCEKSYISPDQAARAVAEDFSFLTQVRRFQTMLVMYPPFFGDLEYLTEDDNKLYSVIVDSSTGLMTVFMYEDIMGNKESYYCFPRKSLELNSFVINQTETPNCDPRAFVPPVEELPCSQSPSSSGHPASSSGSTPASSTTTSSSSPATSSSPKHSSMGSLSSASTNTVSVIALFVAFAFLSLF